LFLLLIWYFNVIFLIKLSISEWFNSTYRNI